MTISKGDHCMDKEKFEGNGQKEVVATSQLNPAKCKQEKAPNDQQLEFTKNDILASETQTMNIDLENQLGNQLLMAMVKEHKEELHTKTTERGKVKIIKHMMLSNVKNSGSRILLCTGMDFDEVDQQNKSVRSRVKPFSITIMFETRHCFCNCSCILESKGRWCF